jgi:hypothetical protein
MTRGTSTFQWNWNSWNNLKTIKGATLGQLLFLLEGWEAVRRCFPKLSCHSIQKPRIIDRFGERAAGSEGSLISI